MYNTPSRSTARIRRFGEVQINPSRLIRTDVFDHLEQNQFGIKFRIRNYSLHDNDTMYNLTHSFFIGNLDTQFLFYFYLQDLRLKNYYKYTDKSDHFQLFDLDDATLNLGFEYENSSIKFYKQYTDKIHDYFRTHDNCFTFVPGGIPGHYLATLIHKNAEGIQIYVIDSNNAPSNDASYLTQSIETFFQKEHPNITCKGYYMVDIKYHLNFGRENGNIYIRNGHCALVAFIFMDILYRNIVFHNNLKFDASHAEVFQFINNMKQYCTTNFYNRNAPIPLEKFKFVCFNFNYKVMKTIELFNTNQDTALDRKYYEKFSVNDIKKYKQNSENMHFTFKKKFREMFLLRNYISTFIGINWQDDPDYTVVPQKQNNYYYFISEDIHDETVDSSTFHFIGINTGFHFQIDNTYTFARLDNQNISLSKVHFLFLKTHQFIQDKKSASPSAPQIPSLPFSTRDVSSTQPTSVPEKPQRTTIQPLQPQVPILSDTSTPLPLQSLSVTPFQRMAVQQPQKLIIPSLPQTPAVPTLTASFELDTHCTDERLVRDRKWYKDAYKLITKVYSRLKNSSISLEYEYKQISHLINCMINKNNSIMNAEEISDTLSELYRRRYDHDYNEITQDELTYLIEITKDLETYIKKTRTDTTDTTPSEQKSIRSKTNTQERLDTDTSVQKSTRGQTNMTRTDMTDTSSSRQKSIRSKTDTQERPDTDTSVQTSTRGQTKTEDTTPVQQSTVTGDKTDMILGRTRYFFKEKYNLIKTYYEQLQEKRPRYSIKQAFPQISQLFNNIINRKYQEMTAEEMIDTLTEINRRISENKIYIDSNGDKNLYYLTRDELLYFVNIIEDLLKKQRAQEDTVDTTPSQQKSIRSKTYGTQEQTETPVQQKSTISSDSTGHSDMIIGTSRYVYKQKYDLIKNYYERFQENTSQYSIKQAFSQISQLLNDLINKDD